MTRIIALIAFLVPLLASTGAVPTSTNLVSADHVLLIDPSSMPVAAGKATLTIGVLERVRGVYVGDYWINVSPYSFKNEKGRLAIVVPDAALATVRAGKTATIVGTATSSGKGGETRHIDATATPVNIDCGKLKLWFMSGDRKMTFEPAYRIAKKQTPAAFASTNMNSLPKRPVAKSHR